MTPGEIMLRQARRDAWRSTERRELAMALWHVVLMLVALVLFSSDRWGLLVAAAMAFNAGLFTRAYIRTRRFRRGV